MTKLRLVLAACAAALALSSPAAAAPLAGSQYDSGDGDQANAGALAQDWQGAYTAGAVKESPDANDDCFVGGVKELSPGQWAFNHSAGGCTPGKSNLRVAYANAESLASTTFGHFAFFRNDTTGNSFLTFELNQVPTTWVNSTGTTIPCRSNGDLLLSYEVGGSTLSTSLYKWTGDSSGPPECPHGAAGTFVGSGTIPSGRFQGTMNSASAIANYVNPGAYGSSFPANSFGEGAVDLPAVLQSMGQSACFGFVQMQVHSRSSSSISSAMIDYTTPVPVTIQSCAVTGTAYQDTDGDGTRDSGEPGVAGFSFYADLNDNGTRDSGEPTGSSDATGFYRILNVPAGTWKIREVPRSGWNCSQPSPCLYTRSLVTGGNSTGNDFGHTGPSTASGTEFHDLDADGVRDAGEPGLSGWTLYADLNGNAAKDAGEPSATTDASGAWSIGDIPSGTYTIREVAPAGWTCSTPTPCFATRAFTSNSSAVNLDFGAWSAATVGGNIFEDVDGDGAARESGDASLTGWQVYDDANGNDAFDLGEAQTSTDASGNYALTGLTPGTHTIRATLQSASWYCTLPGAAAASCERTVSLQSAQTASGQDFGHSRYATVSGTKFDDANNNGLHDSGEGALAGFTFYVDYDGDNALDPGEPSATSNSSGVWSTSAVRAGAWTLREQPNGAYACTRPSPCTYALSLASGGASAGNEFGNFTSRSVSGTVFGDSNANGVDREAGETGVAGWTVYADTNNNSARDSGEPTSVSNSLGQYNLTGLANGSYRIRIVGQGGWTCSFPASCVNTGSIGSGQSDAGKNFGVWGPSVISGTVFEDGDADGLARETGEGGLAGRVVYVDLNGNGAKDSGEPSATSSASGAYSIAGVNPGSYTVRQVVPGGWSYSRPTAGSYSVTIANGDATGRDFGSYTTGSIAGTAYEDGDADGLAREAGESALAGRTVYLDANGNGARDTGETTAATDASGNYSFSGLAPGSYTVRQVVPAGWTQSAPAGAHVATVASQSSLTGRDFASYTTGSITGRAFEDTDFDGSGRQPADSALAGRSVYLDTDGDGVKSAGEPVATSDPGGDYSFGSLAPGTYTVRPVMPSDWACSYPATCSYSVTVTSGSASTARDFGSYVGASVSGTVFEDLDADGAPQESGEAGLAGRRVYLDADADGTRDPSEPTVLTAADGAYSFTGVTARSWQVRVELGAGWSCDSPVPCHHDVTLASGGAAAGRDFGLHAAGSIAGHLYTDRDDDGGPQVFGENDQPERDVYLDANGNGELDSGERRTTTDDNGNYRFGALEPGSYAVRQVLPSGWTCSTPHPCVHAVTLGSRSDVAGQDFSSWTTASFSGTYFEDANADGAYPAADESGLAGHEVYIDSDGNGVLDAGEPTATTNAGGDYSFAGLAPGSYVVRPAALPAGWTCSYPDPCEAQLRLEAGESAQDVDVGVWTPGTVAGTVFADADGDGARGAGEGGQSGWTVYADLDDNGVKDSGEPSAVSDSSGDYSLSLDPGTYTVRRVGQSGWTCTTAGCAHSVTVVSSGAVAGLDFGNAATAGPPVPVPASVSGVVFDDADGDGAAFGSGDTGRGGRTVYADLDGDGSHSVGEPQTVTAADGSYTLTGLAPGAPVTLRADEAAGRTCSRPDPCAYSFTPADGDALTGRDFGSWAAATITGTWWDDADGDGVTGEAGEGRRSGETVFVDLDGNGSREGGEPATTTAADGSYSFGSLAPGSYTVRALLAGGQTCTTACAHTVTLVSGQVAPGQDFASHTPVVVPPPPPPPPPDPTPPPPDPTPPPPDPPVSDPPPADPPAPDPAPAGAPATTPAPPTVAGTLFEDRDADGLAREAGEPPLDGWTVYDDANGNGQPDAGEANATTGPDGRYRIAALPAGDHTLRIVTPAPKWVCSVPAGCERRVLVPREGAVDGQDFGAWRKAKVTGFKFEDRNRDGSDRTAGDLPLPGWRIYVDLNGNGRYDDGEPSDYTDANGRYGITNLPLGTLTLREEAPTGTDYRCTFPVRVCAARISVRSGDEDASADFGAVPGLPAAVNRAALLAPAACQRGRFAVRLRARLARRASLSVDGRLRKTAHEASAGRYLFRLDARRFRHGVHRVAARIVFLDGTHKTVRSTFYRCLATKPRYTG